MYITIEIPNHCTTLIQKRKYFQTIYEWGLENLEDQNQWSFFQHFNSMISLHTCSFDVYIINEIDIMAIKLTW